MSRKPTAIHLSSSEDEAPKPKTKSAAKTANRTPRVLVAPPQDEAEDLFDQTPFMDSEPQSPQSSHLPNMGKGIRWWSILLSALGMLISIVIAFKLQATIDELFTIHPTLGWVALGLTAVAGFALLALIIREIVSVVRLKKLTGIRQDAEQVLLGNKPASKILSSLRGLYGSRPDMRWQFDELKAYENEVLDDADRLKITEKTLMAPLDQEAKQLIASSAKRISVITAINPSPVLDILFVGFQVLQMLRKLMALYGGKPAFFGALKLVRMVATHLAVTGGLAMTDTLLQQFIGKGLAGRLSAKLGEGTVNGIMATRIGLAAIDLCRPLPFAALERPNLKSFLGELFSSNKQIG